MEVKQEKRLKLWLRGQLYGTESELTRFTLCHVNARGVAGTEVQAWKKPEEGWPDPEHIDDLIRDIETAYACDAEGLGDYQKYVLYSHFANTEKRRIVLSYMPAGDEFSDPLDTEGASKGGLTAQLMRHSEVFMKTAVLGSTQTISQLQRENSRLSDMNEKLHERLMEVSNLIETLRSEQHLRDLDMMNAKNNAEIKHDVGKKFTDVILPIFANRITKGRLLPPGTSPQQDMLKSFIGMMTPEQMSAIADQLKPEQQVLMFELIKTFKDADAKDANQTDKPNGTPSS